MTTSQVPSYAKCCACVEKARGVGDDPTEALCKEFVSRGGKPNRWSKRDWDIMAHCLTWVEDRHELAGHHPNAVALGMRRVRRLFDGGR